MITHEGISGPVTLELSAFTAGEFHAIKYQGQVQIHFAPDIKDVEFALLDHKVLSPRKLITSVCPLVLREVDYDNYNPSTGTFATIETVIIPKRLWVNMCHIGRISDSARWSDASKAVI